MAEIRIKASDFNKNYFDKQLNKIKDQMAQTPEADKIIFENDLNWSDKKVFEAYTVHLGGWGLGDFFGEELFQKWKSVPGNQANNKEYVMPSFEDFTGLKYDTNPFKDPPFLRYKFYNDNIEYNEKGEKLDPNSAEYKAKVEADKKVHEKRTEITKPNGKFSQYVIQGRKTSDEDEGTGDCTPLATILALQSTHSGRAHLEKMYKLDKNGNPTVNFLGTGEQCTLKPEELKPSIGKENLSSGDPDYLSLEHCMNRHIQKYASERPELKEKVEKNPYNPISTGNFLDAQVLKDLTGKEIEKKWYPGPANTVQKWLGLYKIDDNVLNKLGKRLSDGEVLGVTASSDKETEGMSGVSKLLDHHAYAIKEINPENKTVTIINPHNASEPIKLTYEQFSGHFKSLGIITDKDYKPPKGFFGWLFG